jgi:LacI family transcriptional regulator
MGKTAVADKSISMKKISELTGVSIATVSRVINNNGRFSEATRKNVLAVINKYCYTPNIVAQGLRKNRTKNIGVIVPNITNEFFAKIALYIQKALFEVNYSTLIYNTDENVILEEKHLQALSAQSVSGIVFISGGDYQNFLQVPAVPTVFLDRKPPLRDRRDDYVRIQTNHFMGGYLAGKSLLESGCRNPAIVMEKRPLHSQIDRFLGFQKVFSEARITIDDNSVIKVDKAGYQDAYQAVNEKVEQGLVNDGYFCTTDWLAVGSMDVFLDRKIKIPGQVKIVGFDNISISEHAKIPLTTIHQDIKGMADLAAEIMIKMLNHERTEKNEFVFEPALIKRQTT